jgi:mannose-6-phosphate isomerase-like protein (cupin superfamily)
MATPKLTIAVLAILALSAYPGLAIFAQSAGAGAATTLQTFADAWRGSQALEPRQHVVLGFWITGETGGEFHVLLTEADGSQIEAGIPAVWDIGFEMDIEVLRRIERGELNALTAMGQAVATDPAPLVARFGSAFGNRPNAGVLCRRVAFQFWSRDWPVVIPFNGHASRFVHGGNAVVLVYDEHFRSAWYQLVAGMHINSDPRQQANEYPQLLIVTRGEFSARFDGSERRLSEGQSVLIPPGMRHEFWAEADEYGEFVWIAFGDGS